MTLEKNPDTASLSATTPSRTGPVIASHGSAIVSTIQQVAGAAGTALFVTLMTVSTTAESASGATPVVATAGGVHTAFFVGACIATVAVVLTFLVCRPAAVVGKVVAGP